MWKVGPPLPTIQSVLPELPHLDALQEVQRLRLPCAIKVRSVKRQPKQGHLAALGRWWCIISLDKPLFVNIPVFLCSLRRHRAPVPWLFRSPLQPLSMYAHSGDKNMFSSSGPVHSSGFWPCKRVCPPSTGRRTLEGLASKDQRRYARQTRVARDRTRVLLFAVADGTR